MAMATKASASQTISQARFGVLVRGDGSGGDGGDADSNATPAGNTSEFAGLLHGLADVAQVVGDPGVDGDGVRI